ncbi:DsbA family protein [Streptomyces flaveolus]|uniref:DsbA family protein n=1 Tax=Streptomyces flaveolus TaxID=67297 RepID=UPI003F4DD176
MSRIRASSPRVGRRWRAARCGSPERRLPRPSSTEWSPAHAGEVYFDILCPWCYVGKVRLTTALAGRDDVGVVWRSLELDPEGSPTAGSTAAEVIAQYQGRPEGADTVARQLPLDLGHLRSRLRRHPWTAPPGGTSVIPATAHPRGEARRREEAVEPAAYRRDLRLHPLHDRDDRGRSAGDQSRKDCRQTGL